MELQLNYDFENDTLFLFDEKLEYKDSIDMNTIIIDFSKEKLSFYPMTFELLRN